MFKHIARYCRQYWQLLVLLVVIGATIAVHYTLSRLLEHWWLAVIALLLVTPAVVKDWQRLRSEAPATTALGYITVVAAVVLHDYTIAFVAALVVVLTDYASQLLLQWKDKRFSAGALAATAHLLRGRKIVDIAADIAQPGDKLVVNHGEVVPVDATILEGTSDFVEVTMTGATTNITKSKGAVLLAGSTNNGDSITIRATQTAGHSQFVSFTKIMQTALAQKAPFVRVAGRFSFAYTILALIVAGGAWYISDESIRAIDVLAVASVFPLLVAVPVAFIRGMTLLGAAGLIVRSSSTFEDLANLQTMAFDVAGILTNDTIRVASVSALKPHTKDEVLTVLASILQTSDSQLATTISNYAQEAGIKVGRLKHVKTLPGNGLQATFRGKTVTVGSLETLQHTAISIAGYDKHAKGLHLYVAIGSNLAGYVTFSDALRPEVTANIAWLQKRHIATLLLSEHSPSYIKALCGNLGFTKVLSGLTRSEKLHAISAVTDRPLAFVGNTSSDNQALTAADVGIALGVNGMPADAGAAKVLTASTSLSDVLQGIAVSRRTVLVAKLAIAIGLGLNLAGMLTFAFGHFSAYIGFAVQIVVNCAAIVYVYWLTSHKTS